METVARMRLGCVQMCSDVFGCVQMYSDVFGWVGRWALMGRGWAWMEMSMNGMKRGMDG